MNLLTSPVETLVAGEGASVRLNRAALLGVGTAVPAMRWTREQTAESLARLWNLRSGALERWRRIVQGSGIDSRHGVLPPETLAPMSTARRMRAYEECAPPLAGEAATRAMAHARIDAGEITDVVIVSCTGFAAPGLDVEIIGRLGLNPRVRRTTIGFMGCFGAINGLRVAAGLCASDPAAATLLVCCELCSLHVRADSDVQNQVASALFADGAAAAVLAGTTATARLRQECAGFTRDSADADSAVMGEIGRSASLLLPKGRQWMTWRITDAGFAMTLTRDVPAALRESIRDFVQDLQPSPDTTFIVHPGGPGVLDAVDAGLGLRGGRGMPHAREVLCRCGNMSSATALFVLEEALRHGQSAPFTLLAFGPGLTIEGLNITR